MGGFWKILLKVLHSSRKEQLFITSYILHQKNKIKKKSGVGVATIWAKSSVDKMKKVEWIYARWEYRTRMDIFVQN